MPRHKCQVSVRALIADQILLSGLLQMVVDDAEHSLDLVAVAVEAVLSLFRMVEYKPGTLAEVRSYKRSIHADTSK